MTLRSLDEDIIDLADILKKVQQAGLLQGWEEFCEDDSLELVKWIREEIEGNIVYTWNSILYRVSQMKYFLYIIGQ